MIKLRDGYGLQGGLFWRVVVEVDIWYGRDRNENVGLDYFGEFFGGIVFVDYGIDAFEAF